VSWNLTLSLALIALYGFGSMQVEPRAMRAKELSDRLPDSPDRFAAHRLMWNSCLLRQPVPGTVALARNLLELARGTEGPVQLAAAYRALGYSLFIVGELPSAAEILAKGAALADGVPDPTLTSMVSIQAMVCRAYGGQVRCLMVFPKPALACARRPSCSRGRNNSHSLAWALCSAANMYWIQGDPAAVARLANEAFETSCEHRLPQWLAHAEGLKGWAMCRLDAVSGGLDLMEKGARNWHATGAVLHRTQMRGWLAEGYLLAGRLALANQQLAAARAHHESFDEGYLGAELWRLTALLSQSDASPMEIVERQLNKPCASLDGSKQNCTSCAPRRASPGCGASAGAEARRAPVYGWFIEGFDTADLKEAKRLLDELT
jgi:hypothetical protein